MSFDPSAIMRTILAGVAAIVLTLAVNVGYGLVFLRLRGAPPQEMLREARVAAPFVILGIFLVAVAAILGARLAAGRAGRHPRLTGLAAGAGLALVVLVGGLIQGSLDFWVAPNAAMAVFGGWLGGWLVGRT
jgi:hypothetical protein